MNVVDCKVLPLLSSQRGLWVGQKINPSVSMTLAESIELIGDIDVSLLEHASYQVAQEFETLRSRIIEDNGVPKICIDPYYSHPIPFIDVTGDVNPKKKAEILLREWAEKKIDLATGPNWYCLIIKKEHRHYVWANYGHHALIDGFSGSMVVQRLSVIYNACLAGQHVPSIQVEGLESLHELEKQYRQSQRFIRDRAFWKQQLADAPVSPTLAVRSNYKHKSGLLRASGFFHPEKVKALRDLGRLYATSLPQVLIALVATYYYRLTRAEDLIFGMPVTGRVNDKYRKIPGLVANAVLIRLKMNPDLHFGELFSQVSTVVKNALRHQQYRYEDIRRDFGLYGQDQQLSTLAVNIEVFDYKIHFGGIPVVPSNISNGSGEDLTIFFYERSNGGILRFDIDSNPSLYEKDEIVAHCRRIELLANQMLINPNQAIGYFDIIDDKERQFLLKKLNQTDAVIPKPATLLHYFYEQLKLSPTAIAVESNLCRLTYEQLWLQVKILSDNWREKGIGHGDIVAIALPRQTELVVALLAVMLTGAAYLPLDINGPIERTQNVLAFAQIKAIACLKQWYEEHEFNHYQWLNPISSNHTSKSLSNTSIETHPDQIAYVIFTSGSTGTPKGVVIRHRSLANFLWAMREEINQCSCKRFLALTTAIFDISGLEFFLPLIVGGTVVIADTLLAHDPQGLGFYLKEKKISLMQATPSMWRIVLSNSETNLSSIHAFVGGEQLPSPIAAELIRRACKVTHLYGPTETTIWSTKSLLDHSALQPPSIGKPICNTQVYILDAQQQILPFGSIGELYIAGEGVAAGYLHQPELTQKFFCQCPFNHATIMYRTGDLARWKKDGVLEFIGRMDSQLKIRGHRVEPGEIENVLLSLPQIKEAVVIGHSTNGSSGLKLVAFIVSKDNVTINTENLRQQIRENLPDYMIPNYFLQIEKLPLLSNGKIDRTKLPKPTIDLSHSYVAPRDVIEEKLVKSWQKLLAVDQIGIHDNFFELGGDSLVAAEFMASFPYIFGMDLPFGVLFNSATIAELADQIRKKDSKESHTDPLGIVLKLREGEAKIQIPLFCVHPVVGLGWSYSSLLNQLNQSLPVYALQSPALKGREASFHSIEDLARIYTNKIRQIQPVGPYRLLGWSLGGFICHAIANIILNEGGKVELLAILDAYPYKNIDYNIDEVIEAGAALRYLGISLSDHDMLPNGLDDIAAILRKEYGIDQIPLVNKLLNEDPEILSNISSLTRKHIHLAQKFRPSSIAVDTIFFQAAKQHDVSVSQFMDDHPDAWKPYVRSLSVYTLDCDHQSMFDQPYANQIADLLNKNLITDSISSDLSSQIQLGGKELCKEQTEHV